MAIVEARDKNGNIIKDENSMIIYKYQRPHIDNLWLKIVDVIDSFEKYVNETGDLCFEKDIEIDQILLGEILVRIDKRKDYFIIFHDATYMNEVKEAGLLAYWLLKLKPFKVKTDNDDLFKKHRHINEKFAVFVLYSVLKEEAKRNENMEFYISDKYTKKILYAFKFWDLSKESLMLIAETLCESMTNKGDAQNG